MEGTQSVEDKQLSCCAPAHKSRWLKGRNLLIGALVLVGVALYFGWNWLVAAGLASVALGVLPCLAMCALGLCMGRMGKKDAATPTSTSLPPDGGQSARHPQSNVQT